MQKLLILIFLVLGVLRAEAQRLFDVQDLITFFSLRQAEKVDKKIKQYDDWYYISSEEKANGDLVDMWMLEREDHEVIGVVLNINHPTETDGSHHQFQLHLKNGAEYQRVLNQAKGLGFQEVKRTTKAGNVKVFYYQNIRYTLVGQVSERWKLPYRLMLTHRQD